jgi:GcrA cell cycle regulator
MEWSEDSIARLRRYWDEGLSLSEIGRLLGTTKNSAMGKVHRLGLTLRGSPITPSSGAQRAPVVKRVHGPTLAPLVSTIAAATAPKEEKPKAAYAPPKLLMSSEGCLYPIGDPGSPGYHSCGKPRPIDKPYCDTHQAICYVRVPRYRADAVQQSDAAD